MKIKPNNQWRWYYDDEHERMMLDLANGMLFRSCFPAKMLVASAYGEMTFNIDDAGLYHCIEEQVQKLSLSNEHSAELILNALVAFRFLKPQMPRSWYFLPVNCHDDLVLGDVVLVHIEDSGQQALFLVAEAGKYASLCLLIEPKLVLKDRVMRFCDPIKIMNNRLMIYQPPASSLIYERAVS